jgi:cyanophycinase
MFFTRKSIYFLGLFALALAVLPSGAQDNTRTFMPIGGGYGDTYDGFIAAALERYQVGDTLKIVVLPITYATNAETITQEELQENLNAAENRRAQLEEACLAGAPEGVTCEVVLAPVFTRPDALAPANLEFFTDDVAAVYILGGDQMIAMQVIMNTPIEEALEAAYRRGALIAGTSAGEAIQSRAMIAGYVGDYGPESGLVEGSVDVWTTDEARGLPFGITNAIFEQHFWERARLGRLLNVLAQPGVPPIGIGVDSYTAAQLSNEKVLHSVFGLYSVGILDAETYGAAENASFKDGILSMHNVLFHILPPADHFSYDIQVASTSMGMPPAEPERNFDSLKAPEGAGTLIVTGSLHTPFENSAILARFVELAGGADAHILAIYDGFASPDMVAGTAPYFEAGLQAMGVTAIDSWDVSGDEPAPESFEGYTGIMFVGNDATIMHPDQLEPLKTAWLSGTPMLADWSASSVLGAYYAAQGQTPKATDDEPYADIDYIQGAFIDGNTDIQPGLGLLDITIETRLLADYRVGRMVALAYAHPDLLAIGLNEETALEISSDGATVLGTNGVFVLDLRNATLDKGTNDGFMVANGLLDVFAPGEAIAASN